MTLETQTIKIGELLVSSGLLDTNDVIEATQVSHRLQIPIGRVLIMSGAVSEQLLQAALQAQLILKEGMIDLESAANALQIVALDNKNLQQALQQLNVAPDYQQEMSNQIVDLLLDSNIVTQEQLDQAMQTSNDADIPLSGALVLQGILSANFFPSILRAHDQIRGGKVSRQEAIDELKASFMIWLKADESWNSLSDAFHKDFESTDALQANNAPFLSVTFEPSGDTKEPTLQAAETNQSPAQTAEPLVEQPVPKLIDLFKNAGICTQQDVQRKYEDMLNDPLLSGRVFQAMGLTDEQTLNFTLRCHNLIKKGLLTEEQAIRAIRGMRSGMVSQEEALIEQTAEQHQYFDKKWRSKTLRAFGGGVVGAVVAGIALTKAIRGR